MSSGDIFLVFEENEPQPLQMFAFHGIQFGRHPASDFVEPVIHELDDVKMIEHDLCSWEVFGKPRGVCVGHIHCYQLQLASVQSLQRFVQCGNSFPPSDMDDRSALQAPHDREKAPVRLTMADLDFVNADRPDFRHVCRGDYSLKIPLFDVLNHMPSQVKAACQRSNADLFPEPKDRSLELG